MTTAYFEDQVYENIDYTTSAFIKGEYDHCIFDHCNFEGVDLVNTIFIDCSFKSCNLSNALINGVVLRDVSFVESKLLGLHFETCSSFGLSVKISQCNADHTSFYECNLLGTIFKHTSFKQADFYGANLNKAQFIECNLDSTQFENCNLESCDFRTSYHIQLDPSLNKMKKAIFSMDALPGLLTKYQLNIK